MPVYRVVILVNLALVAGALAGYFWRQGEIDALRTERERARRGVEERGARPRQWSVSGIVRGSLPDRGALVITHEPIGELMGTMTMAFPVTDPRLLGVARTGERVRFTVVERNGDLVVLGLERENAGR
jgi:Cu/Ag efflux protein CusF